MGMSIVAGIGLTIVCATTNEGKIKNDIQIFGAIWLYQNKATIWHWDMPDERIASRLIKTLNARNVFPPYFLFV